MLEATVGHHRAARGGTCSLTFQAIAVSTNDAVGFVVSRNGRIYPLHEAAKQILSPNISQASPRFPCSLSAKLQPIVTLIFKTGRQSFIMLDCGIIRWEDVFPSHDGEEDPNSYHSTKAIKGQSPPSSSLTSSSPLCLPSVTMVDRRDYEMLQEHRNDLLAQLQSSLQEIKRLNTQSNLYRLEVEQLREERQRVRDALEGRETYF